MPLNALHSHTPLWQRCSKRCSRRDLLHLHPNQAHMSLSKHGHPGVGKLWESCGKAVAHRHPPRPALTYDDVCWRMRCCAYMLTYADVCAAAHTAYDVSYALLRIRMLTYADVCAVAHGGGGHAALHTGGSMKAFSLFRLY